MARQNEAASVNCFQPAIQLAQFIQRHWRLLAFFVIFPTIIYLWTYCAIQGLPPNKDKEPGKGKQQLIVEAFTGWWPSKDHPNDPHTVSIAVSIAALAVFGVPVIIGAYINYVTKLSEERMKVMLLTDHLAVRDSHILRDVYSTALKFIPIDGLPDNQKREIRQQLRAALEDTIITAAARWTDLQSSKIRAEFENMKLGDE